MQIVQGQETPRLQGWYSERYNVAEPAPAAIYTADLGGNATFAWLLLPGKGRVPVWAVHSVALDDGVVASVSDTDGQVIEVYVPLAGKARSVRIARH